MSSLALQVRAAKVTVQWDPSPDSSVAGYKVYAQQIGTSATPGLDVGKATSSTVDNLIEGVTYQFFLTAYNSAHIESDPSNQITYTIPFGATSSGYALQFGGFSHATATYSPHGSMAAAGEMYSPGTTVSLRATPGSGYSCAGWTVNSVYRAGNPTTVSMNQNTVVAPVITKTGSSIVEPPATQISLNIASFAGLPTITVGGELGAWILEGSTSVTSGWAQVATGLTSAQLPISTTAAYAFYRVRSNPLSPVQ